MLIACIKKTVVIMVTAVDINLPPSNFYSSLDPRCLSWEDADVTLLYMLVLTVSGSCRQ